MWRRRKKNRRPGAVTRARATSAPVFKARCAVAWRTEGRKQVTVRNEGRGRARYGAAAPETNKRVCPQKHKSGPPTRALKIYTSAAISIRRRRQERALPAAVHAFTCVCPIFPFQPSPFPFRSLSSLLAPPPLFLCTLPPSPNPRPTARDTYDSKENYPHIDHSSSLPPRQTQKLFTHTSLASSSSLLPQSAASPSAMSTCQPLCGRAPP